MLDSSYLLDSTARFWGVLSVAYVTTGDGWKISDPSI